MTNMILDGNDAPHYKVTLLKIIIPVPFAAILVFVDTDWITMVSVLVLFLILGW